MGSVSTRPPIGNKISDASQPAHLHTVPKPATASKKHQMLPYPRVELEKYGPVEGFRHQLANGEEERRAVNVFLGIPYAKPPVGELRFCKPAEPDAWRPTVLQAKRYRARSVQMAGLFWDAVEGQSVGTSEDCLYLNVIAPAWSAGNDVEHSGKGFPVMMYIHGGAFLFDSAVKYHYKRVARTLVHHGVIVVTIQYRLGLFGYFSTGDDSCAGNFGLWDQLLALKWVKANCAAFGGDPNRITVFGQSAGAAAADLLSILPQSRDLFSRTILMGGSAECQWALAPKEQTVRYCRQWAQKLGFEARLPLDAAEWDAEENQRMMEFLREQPASKFVVNSVTAMTALLNNEEQFGRLLLGPIVDGDLVPRSPKELRTEVAGAGKRAIVGMCKNEGMLFLALARRRSNVKLLAEFERQIQKQTMDLSNTVCQLYGMHDGMADNKEAVTKTCVTLMSDFINGIALHNWCKHTVAEEGGDSDSDSNSNSSSTVVYRFLFEHFNPDNTRALNPLLPYKSATHATELAYVFDVNMFVLPWRRTKADKEVLAMVTKMWTNFAKFGDPNGLGESSTDSPSEAAWQPIDRHNFRRHLRIAQSAQMVDAEEGQRRKASGREEERRIVQMAQLYRENVL